MPKVRTVRVTDALWEAAQAVAAARGETVTDVIVTRLERYVRQHRHLLDEDDQTPG